MRFTAIFTAAFSIFSIVLAQLQLTPAYDPLSLEITERNYDALYQLKERDLITTVELLLSDINITAILDSIDIERIAGWVDDLLNTNDNVQYLDDLLNFLGDTDLIPFLISFIVSNNSTRTIAGDVTVGLLGIAGRFNLTTVFVALRDSGLAYTLIADLIENPNTFPFVRDVVVDLLGGSSGSSATTTAATTALSTTRTTSTATALGLTASAGSVGTAAFASAAEVSLSVDTDIQFSGGSVIQIAGPATSSVSIGSINTASLANLFSAAAAENSGNGAAVATAAATSSASVTVVSAQATAATTAAGSGSAGGNNFLGVTGPAFQSVPTSQFGAGPTSINYSALAQITGDFNSKREVADAAEERNDAVAAVLKKVRKRELNDPVAKALNNIRRRELMDPVAKVLDEIRRREIELEEIQMAIRKMKRDNIQNLLTTIFSSVARSNILNETIDYLVTDQRFESSVVLILRGVFENIGSTLTGILSIDWSSLLPLVRSLIDSGLITDIIYRAFNDPTLQSALWSDITLLFKRDLALRDEILGSLNGTIVSSLPVSEFITAVGAEVSEVTVSVTTTSFNTLSVSTTSGESNSTVPRIAVESANSGFTFGTSLYSTFFALFAVVTMML